MMILPWRMTLRWCPHSAAGERDEGTDMRLEKCETEGR